MYLVKTKMRSSRIHGIGVFADQFIPEGTVVWEFHDGIDHVISPETLMTQSEVVRNEVERLFYLDKDLGVWVVPVGQGCFVNHSDNPNLTHDDGVHAPSVAARDIQLGEELTENYRRYDVASEEGVSEQNTG